MANSKWLDYEGLEYYTKKLDTKFGDYAKTSDLDNYVSSSVLSSELSAYLPLTGGTVTGELSVNGKFEVVNTAAIDDELHVQKLVHAWGDMTVDGSLNIGETTVRASDGHVVLPSGIEIY